MNITKKISSVEYQKSVTRALSNPQNRTVGVVKKSRYIMKNGIPHKFKNGNLVPLTKI